MSIVADAAPHAASPPVVRRRLTVSGIVQGVGFRPFVHALAHDIGVTGHVGNDAAGVFVEIEGTPRALDEFARRLVHDHPPLARIDRVDAHDLPPMGDRSFSIVESAAAEGPRTLVPPDVATCDDCLTELVDPADRRHRYPFVNCTNCGPRFTIIRDLPYDRPATTMATFVLCADCAAEYADPTDRRYHAQPVACPACGPRIVLERDTEHGSQRTVGTDEVIAEVQRLLRRGEIVAIKGLGGYHLACDATSERAVELLRHRKGRSEKPFAVMAADLAVAGELAELTEVEADVLTSVARPIVLVRRRSGELARAVAPGNPLVGVMLPYTPLHHLLFAPVPDAAVEPPRLLVMTSGNRSDEPICFEDDDARARLADLADAFCTHDRPIEVPCDDSVVRVVDGEVQPIRRSRGYAPVPVTLPFEMPPVLGVGGELKNTCCVASGRHAWVGQHVGDMESLATLDAFDASVAAFTTMYRATPIAIGVDGHPGYLTRRWALTHATPRQRIVEVQHHHAHVAAAMAEHGLGLDDQVLGFAFDGTGYGIAADGSTQIWGGEVLRAGYGGFERVAHLAPLPLPGGDEAVRNPCRIALAYLTALGLPLDPRLGAVAACDDVERSVVPRQVQRGVGCVPTTSIGRLFDAVSSLLDVGHRVTYEAQAAIQLEHLAESGDPDARELRFELLEGRTDGEPTVIDPRPVLAGLVEGVRSGDDAADLAAAFHVAVAEIVAALADRHAGDDPIVLTGGVFQNALLTRLVRRRLVGHEVLTHRLVPTNDGGLSLGQAVVAAVATLGVAGEGSS